MKKLLAIDAIKHPSLWEGLVRPFFLLLAFLPTIANATVKLPQLFQSGMVLQRNQLVPIWGTADANETVKITFRGKTYTTTAAADGKWRIDLPKQKHGGPFEMKINDITLTDVLVGDVWIVSGQSNIDTNIERIYPRYKKDLDAYTSDQIHVFQVQTDFSVDRQTDVRPTSWKHVNKENCWKFSAVGYFLGQMMLKRTGIPQGIIQSSKGGSPIQSWIDIDSLKPTPQNPTPNTYYAKYLLYTDKEYTAAQAKANAIAGNIWTKTMDQNDPGLNVFSKADYDDSSWKKVNQYNNREWAMTPVEGSRPSTLGSFWLRQHIKVDAAHAGKPATLHMGTLHDVDQTYVNGQFVGSTGYQYPPRRYKIPAGLLKEGDNVIAVRVICKGGMAFFYKKKPHQIEFDDETLSPVEISYEWLTKRGAVMYEGPLGGKLDTENQASMLYDGMLYPLAPYACSGIVWYQGESNTGTPDDYGVLLKKLTGNWRTLWKRPDLPFNIVQLANHMEPSEQPQNSSWAKVRELQRQFTDNDPYSTLTVNIDLGEASDIHPLSKRELTERIVLGLENSVFGKKNVLSAEPVEAHLDGGKIVLTMDQPLEPCDNLMEFEVKGEDGKFHNAQASTDGKTVVISPATAISQNPTIRFAWKDNPEKHNMKGKNGLPASPFEIVVK